MTGEREGNSRCPLCGGRLQSGQATVPFLLPNAVILIKDVPAEVCSSCHEPYTTGKVTDRIVSLLNSVRVLQAEVLILSYSELQPVSTFTTAVEYGFQELLNEQIAQAGNKMWEQGPTVQAEIRKARAVYRTGDYILEELVKLPAAERLTIVEATLHLIRKDLQQVEPLPARTKRKQQLAAAAKALLPDYAAGGELTVFTALDSEDFYAQG